MEIVEESEEEDELDDQVQEERVDEGPVYETDDGEDPTVMDGNYPERPMNDLTTPISFRTFRHPGRHLWKRTPRKSIPQMPATHFQRPPLTAAWEAKVRVWNPRGLDTTEVGESSRSSHPLTSGSDHSASIIAGLERRVTQLEAQLAIAIQQIESMAGQNHITGIIIIIKINQCLEDKAVQKAIKGMPPIWNDRHRDLRGKPKSEKTTGGRSRESIHYILRVLQNIGEGLQKSERELNGRNVLVWVLTKNNLHKSDLYDALVLCPSLHEI
ncbi:hypothetical protein LXL04_022718 [Taraxacum kok-saghyz]